MNLELDLINAKYAALLQERNRNSDRSASPLKLADSPAVFSAGPLAYSTAIAPAALLQALPVISYASLKDPSFAALAKEATFIRKKMFAGIGSSIERTTHLIKHRPTYRGPLGAKGTDLFITVPHPRIPNQTLTLSFAEAQLIQGCLAAERGDYAKVQFDDLVSEETQSALQAIWDQPCLLDPSRSYARYFSENPVLSRGPMIVQAGLPTLTPDGNSSRNRLAPAGHGFFGFELLHQLLHASTEITGPVVSFLSNGEDLSATPDPFVTGWMLKNAVPLCMILTEKTEQDRKGGQLAIVAESGTPQYVTLIETAQAKAIDQLKLFEELGLSIKTEGQQAYFNTNLAVFNETILRSSLLDLKQKIGEAKFLEALTPDVILNWKEQVDEDGVKRKYLQLEGAMGSVFLGLDRCFRRETGKPLVHFVLVSKEDRAKFFAPVKTAFDLFLQFYSNLYTWDPIRFCPVNKHPAKYPMVKVESEDVETVLEQYKNTDLTSYFP